MIKQIISGKQYHHPGLIPWLFIIASTIILTSLGVWQMQRLVWKEALLHKIEAGQQLVPLMRLPAEDAALEALLYRQVKLTTNLHRSNYFLRVGIHRSLGKGYHVLSPMHTGDAGAQILVNRGFVAGETQEVKDALAAEELKGPTIIEGVLRPAYKARLFSPSNHPDKNIWFSEDVAAMKQYVITHWPPDGKYSDFRYVPYVIEATAELPMQGKPLPTPNTAKVVLRNDHLGYAITWFGLAIVGVVMFFFYCCRKPSSTIDEA